MKGRLVILLLLFAFVAPCATAQRRHRDYLYQEWVVENGDSVPLIHLAPIRKYARKPDMRRYARLVRAVKKVYPLAQQAQVEMARIEREILAIADKEEQQRYAKAAQRELVRRYKPVILKMTISEGKVLLKLIDRQTDQTAFQIIKEFRGGFVAGFWQAMAKLFGNNLKLDYQPEQRDRLLEQIVVYYEKGLL